MLSQETRGQKVTGLGVEGGASTEPQLLEPWEQPCGGQSPQFASQTVRSFVTGRGAWALLAAPRSSLPLSRCKRWQEYTEELYKKDLHDPEINHDGVITHLEPDILECEVNRALESITTNKASGGDGIPVELFQILEDDAVKVLHSICQQIWKIPQWPQDWKRSVFI